MHHRPHDQHRGSACEGSICLRGIRGSASRGSASRGSALGGGCMHAPDNMHPTGMLSCLICYLFLIIVMFSDGLIMCHICVFSMFITINTKMSTLTNLLSALLFSSLLHRWSPCLLKTLWKV